MAGLAWDNIRKTITKQATYTQFFCAGLARWKGEGNTENDASGRLMKLFSGLMLFPGGSEVIN